jgi:tetratricopeptide (TPR) repeat protein
MNRISLIVLLLFGFSTSLLAQRPKAAADTPPAASTSPAPATAAPAPASKPTSAEGEVFNQMYRMALRYNDPSVALLSLYHRIAENPQETSLKDSLMGLYFALNQYTQALSVVQDLKASNYENLRTLEVEALSFRALGRPKESLAAYEKLYEKTKQVYHLYQIASIQYQLKRLGECIASLNDVILNPEAAKEKVSIAYSQEQSQQVIIQAAAHNIRGVVYQDQKLFAEARADYEAALKLAPDFVLARNNLEALKKAESGTTAPARTPTSR